MMYSVKGVILLTGLIRIFLLGVQVNLFDLSVRPISYGFGQPDSMK
jgi:hypothetical protein